MSEALSTMEIGKISIIDQGCRRHVIVVRRPELCLESDSLCNGRTFRPLTRIEFLIEILGSKIRYGPHVLESPKQNSGYQKNYGIVKIEICG